MVPYSMLIWLKKSTVLTATHSLRSSPSGSMTASLRFPLPSVAAACFIRSYWWVPSGMFFFGLKVLEERPPLGEGHSHGRMITPG
uniref:Putative secreted protein n=1 Tax=Ixodes ricinus TaxID=34613 RepID=A0A6B0UET4_IXORI